jgi:hypothetical protein
MYHYQVVDQLDGLQVAVDKGCNMAGKATGCVACEVRTK